MHIKSIDPLDQHSPTEYILPIVIISLTYIFSYFGFLNQLRYLVHSLVIPVREGQNLFLQSIKNEYSTLIQATTMRQEIEKLKEENTTLQSQVAYLITVKEENKELYNQLKIIKDQKYKYTPTRIVESQNTLLLNSADKQTTTTHHILISQNTLCAVAISQEGNLIKASFLSDYNVELPVLIVDSQSQSIKGAGTVRGNYGTSILLDKVTQDVTLHNGYQIVLQPQAAIPPDILVGTISEIQRRESDIFQQAFIQPTCNLSRKHTLMKVQPEL